MIIFNYITNKGNLLIIFNYIINKVNLLIIYLTKSTLYKVDLVLDTFIVVDNIHVKYKVIYNYKSI